MDRLCTFFYFVNPIKTLVAVETRSFHWLIMGKRGSCNNLKTTCSFLMKLAIWIDSKVENFRNYNAYYFNLSPQYKLLSLWQLEFKKADPAINSKIHVVFS